MVYELARRYDEMKEEYQALLRVVRVAEDLEHPDYPAYDWPSGSTEYEARPIPLKDFQPPNNYHPVTKLEMDTILEALMN